MRARDRGGRVRAQLASLSERDRRALGLGALILLPALLWAGVVRPYVSSLQELNDRLSSERALLARERAVLADSASYPHELKVATAALGRWEARFIRSPNLALAEAEITSVVEDLARQSRVLLQEVRAIPSAAGAAAPPEGLQPLRMSVSGESDFEGILSLLRGLEHHDLLFRIVGVSVDRAGGRTAGGGENEREDGGPAALSFVIILEAFAPAEVGRSEVVN